VATEVYTKVVLTLLDDEEVEVRPLSIAKLRKFMRMWSDHIAEIGRRIEENEDREEEEVDFTNADLTELQFDVFIKMCALSLEEQVKNDKTEKQFLAHLENVLDQETIYKILEVSGGLDLKGANAPNQSPAATSPVAGGPA
jgi:hypothetical protein